MRTTIKDKNHYAEAIVARVYGCMPDDWVKRAKDELAALIEPHWQAGTPVKDAVGAIIRQLREEAGDAQ